MNLEIVNMKKDRFEMYCDVLLTMNRKDDEGVCSLYYLMFGERLTIDEIKVKLPIKVVNHLNSLKIPLFVSELNF